MIEDPIVEEVRRNRRAIAAQFNNDLDAIVAYLRKRERTSGHKLIRPPKRRAARRSVPARSAAGKTRVVATGNR